ncbi:MerR family DNA-binding transcriptional regulator [Fodinicurvata sp. EGI_FJ10296]|uniref:MerR family transcriptional regulator n=1 Tax=Fodinicurvata sp. EGI_FJ10296 TaxID=3231908 RepID=UPI003453A0B6
MRYGSVRVFENGGNVISMTMAKTKVEREDDRPDGRTWSIGDLADEFGLTHRTIRFYEDEGLVTPARKGTTRVYSRADRARVKLICRGKRLGFSIAEIAEFLKLYDSRDRQIGQMRFALERARDRIGALEQQLVDVRQTLSELRDIEQAIVDHLQEQGAADAGRPTGE